MEDEENGLDYNSVGMNNKAIDKISGKVQKMSGTTGSVSRNPSPGTVSNIDKKYFEGIKKFTQNRPSGGYGGVEGYKVKQALMKNDYAGASQAMKNLKSTNKEAFNMLNKSGINHSGFTRGSRYSDNKSTYTGKLSSDTKSRTDKTFDPTTQKTTEKKYTFN
jgi:hypothetical protein